MLRAYKYRLYPNEDQIVLMSKHFGCCRWIYNWALEKKIESWKTEGKSLNRYELDAKLPMLKKTEETVWLSEVNAQSLQQELVSLEKAYRKFFKEGIGFPKFKSKKNRQRFQCPQRVNVNFDAKTISFPKFGSIKAAISRQFDGQIKTVTVSRDSSGKHYASVLVETGKDVEPTQMFDADTTIGIDLGLKDFATLSTEEKISNPRFLKGSLEKVAREQRRLSRKQKSSKNRQKQRIKVALAYEKVRFQRQDFLHKLSTRIIRENQAVALESLNVKGMVKNRKLARSISDVGWSEFVRQLEYKATWYGKTILRIGQFDPSSRLCTCGVLNRELKLSDREWVCQHCGTVHDRDVMAANNIKQMALSQIRRDTSELTPVESSCGKCTL